MKYIVIMLFALTANVCVADQLVNRNHLSDEQCKRNVDALLSGIDAIFEWNSNKQRPLNLYMENIKRFENENGSCLTEVEIKKRLEQYHANLIEPAK